MPIPTLECETCHQQVSFAQWFGEDCPKRDFGHKCQTTGWLGVYIPLPASCDQCHETILTQPVETQIDGASVVVCEECHETLKELLVRGVHE